MIGFEVKIKKTKEIKIVSEIENIEGVDIFYMSDSSSYVSDEFVICKDYVVEDTKKLNDTDLASLMNTKRNRDAFFKICDRILEGEKKREENKNILNKKKKKTKTIKIFGWTITFTKSK